MIPNPTNGEQEHSAVILRMRGDHWMALRGVLGPNGLSVQETHSFPREEAPANVESEENGPQMVPQTALGQWLEKSGNPSVYMVLPAGLTISRVLDLSQEDDQDIEQSLRLQAESHLLGGSSAHRVGMAPLPFRNENTRQGIVITWPESSKFETPRLIEEPFCISETAALLAMMSQKPLEEPLLHVERATGSLALILEHEGRLVVRSTRENDSDDAHWRQAIVHAVIETAVTDNQPTEYVEDLRDQIREALKDKDELLLLPKSVREHLETRVQGAGDDAWWQEWGVSVGALLATRGQLQMLTTLTQRKPAESGGTFGEVNRALSQPGTAAAILVAAFFAIALLPLLAAWLRLSIVESKIDDQAQLEQILTTSEQQKAIYAEMGERSWPMTKLLGDVANCIPLGIELDQITISEGDAIILRGSAGSIRGSAGAFDELDKTPKQLLQEMGRRFDETLIFSNWRYKDEPIDSGGKIDFSINLSLAKPFNNIRDFAEDFGEKSHAERRYAAAFARIAEFNARNNPSSDEAGAADAAAVDANEERGETTVVARNDSAPTRPSPPPRTTTSSSNSSASDETETRSTPPGVGRESLLGVRGGNASRNRASSSSSNRTGTISGSTAGAVRRSEGAGAVSSGGPAPVPDEFTDTELAALSNSEAKDLLGRVARAKLRKDLDDETAGRLREDVYRILEHMKSTPASGGS